MPNCRRQSLICAVSIVCLTAACSSGERRSDDVVAGSGADVADNAAAADPAIGDPSRLLAFTAFPYVETFVEFESPQQLRDTVGTVVFATLIDARPGDEVGRDPIVEPATIHVDFEVTSTLGGRSYPYRSPEVTGRPAITVVLPINVADVDAARQEIASLAGMSYLLFLGEKIRLVDGEETIQPLYKLWPDPVGVLVQGADGRYWTASGVSSEVFAEAIERGRAIDPEAASRVAEDFAGPSPVHPLFEAFVGTTRIEIEAVLQGIPGQRTTELPVGVVPVEPAPFETIVE